MSQSTVYQPISRSVVRRSGIVAITLMLISAMVVVAAPARGASGGPVVLMGIDAEDGGPGAHGPISVYEDVVTDILGNVTNGGSGILVFGSGKTASAFGVTAFWTTIGTDLGVTVTHVNGAANITAQSLAGFAMVAVVSDDFNTFFGGLTEAENNALAARSGDIALFVNGGGGLIGFSQSPSFTQPYGYLGTVGAFTTTSGGFFSDIAPTAAGLAIGITDALDVSAWHDEYLTFPAFLTVLATYVVGGNVAALGGAQVIIGPAAEIDIKPGSDPNSINLKNKNGVIPVGLLGSETFDVTTVDVTTLVFEGALPDHDLTDAAVYAGHLQDVNDDGFLDLVSHYRAQETGLTGASIEGCLDFTADSVDFTACDAVRIVKS